MSGEQIVWILAWVFFLICGGVMMLGVYLIFGRKGTQGPGEEQRRNRGEQNFKR